MASWSRVLWQPITAASSAATDSRRIMGVPHEQGSYSSSWTGLRKRAGGVTTAEGGLANGRSAPGTLLERPEPRWQRSQGLPTDRGPGASVPRWSVAGRPLAPDRTDARADPRDSGILPDKADPSTLYGASSQLPSSERAGVPGPDILQVLSSAPPAGKRPTGELATFVPIEDRPAGKGAINRRSFPLEEWNPITLLSLPVQIVTMSLRTAPPPASPNPPLALWESLVSASSHGPSACGVSIGRT